jgi:dihydrofolate reductase
MYMSDIRLSLIVAMASNRVIGRENGLPWRLPKDLAYFKRITMGRPIIMGRKTFDSIGRPLPGRCNIVVTTQSSWTREGVLVAHSLEQAIDLAHDSARALGVDEIMLIGGESLYKQALSSANRLYVTEVHGDVLGDAYFPKYPTGNWLEMSREDYFADIDNPFNYSFVVYSRVA